MSIEIVLGDNGTGKTRYLKKQIEIYTKQNKEVITNIKGYEYEVELSKNKMKCIDSSDYVCDIGSYQANALEKIRDYRYKQYMSLIVNKGDVLILDEPEVYLNSQQMYDLCNCLCELKNAWEKIIISGHTSSVFLCFVTMANDITQTKVFN